MADYIHVNLLPIEYRVAKKDYSWLLDARVVAPILLLAAFSVFYGFASSYFESTLEKKREVVAALDADIARNAYVADKIAELERLRDERNAKNNSLKSISVSKKKWVRILEGVNKSLPLNMWLESVKQNDQAQGDMEIRGRTYIFPEVAQYMLELEKNDWFSKVTLNSIELQKEQENTSFLFTIRVSLNPNVQLDRLTEGMEQEEYL